MFIKGIHKDKNTQNQIVPMTLGYIRSVFILQCVLFYFITLLVCGETYISQGVTANKTYHPWNAGIYRALKNGKIVHICGGTLITEFCVLTAAHCVTNVTEGRLIDANKFKITFAKHYIKYNDSRDTGAVYRDVLRIYVPLEYQGKVINYLSDVAILELTSSVPLGESIMPAYVDKNNENIIISSMLGTVVGWGLDSNNMPAEELQRAELSYITLEECRNSLINEERIRITNDKFCTIKRNESNPAVQQGDSGSGIIFKFWDKHYIYGLTSTKINDVVDTFTNIQFPNHLRFIKETMQNINKSRSI